MVDSRYPRKPGVDDRAYAGHREAGLRHGGRQHHPSPIPRPERFVLPRHGKSAVQRQHVGVQPAQLRRRPGDFPGAGQESQDVTVPFGQCKPDGGGDRRLDALSPGGWLIAERDRVRARLRGDHRRVAEQLGQPPGRDRRRGGQQPQIVPQPGADVEEQGEQQIGVEMPLVTFVEQHSGHAGQLRIVLHAADEQAGGDDFDPGPRGHLPVATHRVPHRLAHRFAQ